MNRQLTIAQIPELPTRQPAIRLRFRARIGMLRLDELANQLNALMLARPDLAEAWTIAAISFGLEVER